MQYLCKRRSNYVLSEHKLILCLEGIDLSLLHGGEEISPFASQEVGPDSILPRIKNCLLNTKKGMLLPAYVWPCNGLVNCSGYT